MSETVKVSAKVQEQAKSLLLAAQTANDRFRTYLEGCKDGLGLEGDWNLNTQTWEFTKVEGDK